MARTCLYSRLLCCRNSGGRAHKQDNLQQACESLDGEFKDYLLKFVED